MERFISEDPSGNGTNWYAYCANNPVGCLDINGRETGTAMVL
jgi:RHS repeat-associated protein